MIGTVRLVFSPPRLNSQFSSNNNKCVVWPRPNHGIHLTPFLCRLPPQVTRNQTVLCPSHRCSPTHCNACTNRTVQCTNTLTPRPLVIPLQLSPQNQSFPPLPSQNHSPIYSSLVVISRVSPSWAPLGRARTTGKALRRLATVPPLHDITPMVHWRTMAYPTRRLRPHRVRTAGKALRRLATVPPLPDVTPATI